jgi:prepilin-type N-terminal cleavage/methylation domain-containing protein
MPPNQAPRTRSPLRRVRRLAGQDGFTLIEMLVVTLLLSGVVAALVGPMVTSQRVQNRDASYAAAQQEARTGLDSMVSQIRQARVILSTDSNAVEMNVSLNGTAEHVYYECDVAQPGSTQYRQCVRVQAAAGSALPSLSTGTAVIRNLTNGTTADPVFSFAADPAAPYYMTATIKVPASDGTTGGLQHSIVLSDGALMRNQNVGN